MPHPRCSHVNLKPTSPAYDRGRANPSNIGTNQFARQPNWTTRSAGPSTAIRGKSARELESMMNRLIQLIMTGAALSIAGAAVGQATHTTATTKSSTTTHTTMKAKPASAASEEKMESKTTEKAEKMHATGRHHRRHHHHHAMVSKPSPTKK